MTLSRAPVPTTDEGSQVRQNTSIQQLFNQVGSITKGRTSLTANYTVKNTDKYANLGLNSGFFTVTFSNPSNYDTNFTITITNEDSLTAKSIVLTNYADGTTYTFFLWPYQSYRIFPSNGKWFILGGKRRWEIPTGTAITFYADPAGSDSNDGLDATRACASVLTVWDRIRDETSSGVTDITIQMKQGATFGALGEFDGDSTGNFGRLIEIIGDNTLANPPTVSVGASSIGIKFRDGAWASLSGIKFVATGSGSTAIDLEQSALVDVADINWGAFAGGIHLAMSDSCLCNITGANKISGAAGTGWQVTGLSRLFVSATFDGASAVRNFANFFLGEQALALAEFSGAVFNNCGSFTGQKYNLSLTSVAISGGVTLPGSVAGTADATSVYS